MQDFLGTYIANNFILISMLVCITVCLVIYPSSEKKYTHIFSIFVPSIFASSIFDWLDYWISENVDTFTWWRVITSYMGYTIKVALIGMILILFVKGFKWQLFIGIPAIANALMYTTMFYTHWNAWFDDTNHFHSGPLKYTYMVVSAYYAVLFLHAAIKMFRDKNAKEALFLIPVGLIILGGVIIEAYTELKNCTSTAIALSLLIFYLSLYIIPTKYDAVTGLLNRSIYKMDLAQRKNLKAVISLDVNFLKELNDTYGHEAGDKALCVAGKVIQTNSDGLKKEFDLSTIAYRIGGDEFAILLFGNHPADVGTIDKLIRFIQEGIQVYGYSIAAGFCTIKDNMTYEDVIREADAKMYENKEFIKQEMKEKTLGRMSR